MLLFFSQPIYVQFINVVLVSFLSNTTVSHTSAHNMQCCVICWRGTVGYHGMVPRDKFVKDMFLEVYRWIKSENIFVCHWFVSHGALLKPIDSTVGGYIDNVVYHATCNHANIFCMYSWHMARRSEYHGTNGFVNLMLTPSMTLEDANMVWHMGNGNTACIPMVLCFVRSGSSKWARQPKFNNGRS